MKKYFMYSSHPDDEALGVGGSLIKRTDSDTVNVIIFSDGKVQKSKMKNPDRLNAAKGGVRKQIVIYTKNLITGSKADTIPQVNC